MQLESCSITSRHTCPRTSDHASCDGNRSLQQEAQGAETSPTEISSQSPAASAALHSGPVGSAYARHLLSATAPVAPAATFHAIDSRTPLEHD